MCQAAAEGVVDFRRADPRSYQWWLNLHIRLDRLEAGNLRNVQALDHAASVALLARDNLTDESYEKVNANADAVLLKVKQSLFPWVTFDKTQIMQRAADALAKQWTEVWGDPNDPKVKARIDATAAAMLAAAAPNTRR